MNFNNVVAFGYTHSSLYKLFYTIQFSLASLAIRVRFELLNDYLRYGNALNLSMKFIFYHSCVLNFIVRNYLGIMQTTKI